MIGSIHAVGFSRRRKKISAVGTCRKKEIIFNGSSRYSSWVYVFLHIIIVVSRSKQRIRVSPIGQLQKIGETENSVTIEYWAYASEQQAMSVELDVNTAEKVSFEAVDKKRREIPVTVKLSQAGTYVLELDSVQPDFQAVSLRVTVEGKIIRLYTNEKQVDQVKELKFYQDLDGYYQARINRNIQSLEQEIADQKELIQKLNEEISSCQKQIDQTNERLPYLSRQQRTDAENSIEDWKKQIESYQTQQKEAKERITELTDEIENQKKLISGEVGVPESNTENSVTGEIKETDSSVSESDMEQVEGESK